MFSTGTATSFSGIAPSWPVYNDELARGYPVTDTPILFLQGTLDGQTEQQCVRGKIEMRGSGTSERDRVFCRAFLLLLSFIGRYYCGSALPCLSQVVDVDDHAL